jgi:hypothetical protein
VIVAHRAKGALLRLRAKDESPDPPLTVVSPAGPGCSPQPGPVFIHSDSTPRRSSGEITRCDVGADKAWRVFHFGHIFQKLCAPVTCVIGGCSDLGDPTRWAYLAARGVTMGSNNTRESYEPRCLGGRSSGSSRASASWDRLR